MELTVQNVYGLLLRSHLLSLDEAKAMYARWQTEARDGATNLARFASWMVANKYLTEYQASLLARGHADGFFLNDYKILDRLGQGRMAGVYKAQHQTGQVVAIKVLPPSRAQDPLLRNRFHREARLVLRLKHPNIVRAFQTGVAGDLNYIVMEYLEGETLEEILVRRKKFLPGEAVRLVYQALQGLQHIHTQGLVHRDLKPANLMVVGAAPDTTLRAAVKILDIGLGRMLAEETTASPAMQASLTGEGVLLGTPDYMAPEQARDARRADVRADIYSLGCVLYHLLAGHPPFPDTNIISQMIRHATEPARPLKEFNPAVPDGLQQILNWMLAKDPAARYPTPERAAQALQVFLAAGAVPIAPEPDVKLRKYLTWLEVDNGKPSVPAAPPPAPPAAPAAMPVAAVAAPAAVPVVAIAAPAAKAPVATPPPVPAAVPPPVPAPTANGARPSKPPQLPATHNRPQAAMSKRRARKQRRSQANMPPPPLPAGEPGPINVELVPLPLPASPATTKVLGMRISRRDLVLFGLGAAAGAIVTVISCLLALRGK